MIFEAHCLTCDTITIIDSEANKEMQHFLSTDATLAKVEHNKPNGKPCNLDCIFCLTDDME